MNSQALQNRAIEFHQKGNLAEAERLYLRVLEADPGSFTARHMLGVIRLGTGKLAEALELIGDALKSNPDDTGALSNYGYALIRAGRLPEALASYDRALAIGPKTAETLCNRANILWEFDRPEEALAGYDEALAIKPNLPEALISRSNALRHLHRFEEALESCDRALAIRPNDANGWNNRGVALAALHRNEEALASYERALAIRADFAQALGNRAGALLAMKRFEEALQSCARALTIAPNNAEALGNRGGALLGLMRPVEALASCDRALAIKPNLIEALSNRGHALRDLKRFEEALAVYDRVLAIAPQSAEAFFDRGSILSDLGRLEEALENYEKARDFNHPQALGLAANMALDLCDWTRTARYAQAIKVQVAAGTAVVLPFILLGYSGDAALQLKCARDYVQDRIATRQSPAWGGSAYRHDRIRIAYLSSDLRTHPMASVVAELFELHDRSRFEVFAFSLGDDDQSGVRARLVKGVDHFIDVRSKSDREAARLLRENEVDIIIDLNGHTKNARPEILSQRPAPLQVSYMGYPGTMGADFIDYIIADEIVLPVHQQVFFSEKIVYLPGSYWANDSKRTVAEATPSRKDAGLPEQGFVFCCFNNNRKIAAAVFDNWMRLLGQVPGSVLWLLTDNPSACNNFRQAAAAAGIDPGRLVFAARVESAEHLARHRLADIVLDTLPYNAHTTASDALWMGVPVVTCLGEAFAGRVAASLLHAVGLPELVTQSLNDYEALALRLAQNPSALLELRQKLEQNRLTHPLFDTNLFRRHFESALTTMCEISRRGEASRSFRVSPDS
jgi:predicted O-linked N-acetylglucosamine transferase (SPINDLY family)